MTEVLAGPRSAGRPGAGRPELAGLLPVGHDMIEGVLPQPVLVGRDAELTELSRLLGIPTGGQPAVAPAPRHVLLSGDAGVGKTRLLAELAGAARQAGWQVLLGHCLDFGESALPYLPFSEVLARTAAERSELVERVAADFPALTRLQPGRRVLDARDAGEEGSLDRASLLEAVRALLETLATQSPVLLVIEDAHWADRSTRDLLSFLFTRPFVGPVGVVTSYRADDLHRRHPLRPQVAEWARLGSVERLALGPLPEEAVRALVATLAAAPVGEAELARIVARAEGNAFFVEELVGAACGPDGMPEDLADVLLVRLDRLDDTSRQVVRTASVAGREVSHARLAQVTGLADADLEEALRRAVEMHVLTVGPGGDRYAFRHALLGEAVYDDLLPGERVRLHSRYAAALLDPAAGGSGTAAELARHALLAHDLDTALAASIRAGDEALAVGGPDEAAQHFQQAIELLPGREDGVDVAGLTVKAAEALSASGQAARAATLVAERLAALPADAPAEERVLLLIAQAEALYVTEAGDEPVALSRQAFALVPDDGSLLRARVLSSHARIISSFGFTEEAEQAGLEALALAERHNDAHLVSETVTTLSGFKRTGPKEALRTALQEAVARADAADAAAVSIRGRFLLGRSYQDHGEFDEALEWFASGQERARAAGIPWAPYALESTAQRVATLVLVGRWDEALAAADTRQAPPIAAAVLDVHRLAVEQARGVDVTEAALRLRPFWPIDGIITIHAAALELRAAGRRCDARAALAVYDEAVGVLGAMWREWFDARLRLAAQTLAAISAALPSLPAAERAGLREPIARLHGDGRAVVTKRTATSSHWGPEGRAWEQRLEAEALRSQWLVGGDAAPASEELVAAWRAAEEAFAQLHHVHELAAVRVALATVLRAAGDAAWREVAAQARAAAQQLGTRPLLEELTALGAAPSRNLPETNDALTPREQQILALVAEGRSNGEIARQLFISAKTVSVHVSNILGKLGAAGRTEAAAIARRRGLLSGAP